MSDQRTIVITGASTGIGAACAVGLAKRGYRVFAGVRKPEDGDRVRQEGGDNLSSLILDVTDQSTIDGAVQTVQEAVGEGGLYGLMNNAGISVNGPLEFVSPEELRWQFEVNCVGQLAVTQAFLPMIRKAKGRIISTGSVGGFVTTPLLGPYCMSKYAMEAFSDALRVELKPQGIHVILLEPASIATPIWDKGLEGAQEIFANPPDGYMERYAGFVKGIQKFADQGKNSASNPDVVLDAVVHALESPRPKTRYIMGAGAGQRRFLHRLPDKLRDRAFLKAFGI